MLFFKQNLGNRKRAEQRILRVLVRAGQRGWLVESGIIQLNQCAA